MVQNLFRCRNALPLTTQTHVEKLCEIAASYVLCQVRKISSPPPSYSHMQKFHGFSRDEFGLPVSMGDSAEPLWIVKRKEFLKKLSVKDRNLLLTGDSYFRFDPVVYDCFFFRRRALPPILQNIMVHIIPNNILQSDSESKSESQSDIDLDHNQINLNETAFQTASETLSGDSHSNHKSDEDYNTVAKNSSHNTSSENLLNLPCAPTTPSEMNPAHIHIGRPYSYS